MTCGDSGEEELLTRKSRQTEQALIFLQILEIKRIKKQTARDSGLIITLVLLLSLLLFQAVLYS